MKAPHHAHHKCPPVHKQDQNNQSNNISTTRMQMFTSARLTLRLGLALRPLSVANLISSPTPLWSSNWNVYHHWIRELPDGILLEHAGTSKGHGRTCKMLRRHGMLMSVTEGNKGERVVLSLPKRGCVGRYPDQDRWGETFQYHPYCNQTSYVWGRSSQRGRIQRALLSARLLNQTIMSDRIREMCT
jgi:hypothetical protein